MVMSWFAETADLKSKLTWPSSSNYNSLGGPLHRELYQDAFALEESIIQQQQGDDPDAPSEQWQEWSLLATDGDTAFLLELTSETKVRNACFSRACALCVYWKIVTMMFSGPI